jgi:hypothetical protein
MSIYVFKNRETNRTYLGRNIVVVIGGLLIRTTLHTIEWTSYKSERYKNTKTSVMLI